MRSLDQVPDHPGAGATRRGGEVDPGVVPGAIGQRGTTVAMRGPEAPSTRRLMVTLCCPAARTLAGPSHRAARTGRGGTDMSGRSREYCSDAVPAMAPSTAVGVLLSAR
jgi:hypothetical protein